MTQGANGSSTAARLVVVVLLAIGLVGMHHLVVTACHHASAASAAHVTHADADHTGPLPGPAAPPDESPGGVLGAAAMCLAIVLLLALAAPRALGAVRRIRVAIHRVRGRPLPRGQVASPSLTLLSVCRT